MPAITPKKIPKSATAAFSIGEPEDRILRALITYHYLTAPQVLRLFYSPGSKEEPQRRLKRLADAGYLLSLRFPGTRLPYVYRLARKGLNYCQALGLDVFARFNAGEEAERSIWPLRHTLAISDALIGLAEAAAHCPAFGLETIRHERELKRTHRLPLKLPNPDGSVTPTSYVPDAWFSLLGADEQGRYRQGYCLEIDLSTEERKAFAKKLRRILAAPAPYRQVYGGHRLRVAFIVAGGRNPEKRRDDLVAWTEAELRGSDSLEQLPQFWFCAADPATLSGEALYLGRCWRRPGVAGPTWLVEEAHRRRDG